MRSSFRPRTTSNICTGHHSRETEICRLFGLPIANEFFTESINIVKDSFHTIDKSCPSCYPLVLDSRYLIIHNVENRQWLALPGCTRTAFLVIPTSSFATPTQGICSRVELPEAVETKGRSPATEAVRGYAYCGHRVPGGKSRSYAQSTQFR